VFGSIEDQTIVENQMDVRDELGGRSIPAVSGTRIWPDGVGRGYFALDGAEVHGILNDGGIVRNSKCDRVNRVEERCGLLDALQRPDCRRDEPILARCERRRANVLYDCWRRRHRHGDGARCRVDKGL